MNCAQRDIISIVLFGMIIADPQACGADGCWYRNMSTWSGKQYMAQCISSCLELNLEETQSQKCFYHHNNGSLHIKTPPKRDFDCPAVDCNSEQSMFLKKAMAIFHDSTRISKQKKFCDKRYYFSITEMPIIRGMHLCPCYVEKTQLWAADSVEKIKCVLDNLPETHRQKGMLMTAGYKQGPLLNRNWCTTPKQIFSPDLKVEPLTKIVSNETCLILVFTTKKKSGFSNNDFSFREVSCQDGNYFVLCESI